MYFNYHAKIKKLITENHLINIIYTFKYNSISPAIVFIFDNHKPMPIRSYRFNEYLCFLKEISKKNNKYEKLLSNLINNINNYSNKK